MSVRPAEPAESLAQRASHFTLADLFRRSARLYADRPAVVCESITSTYRELDERTGRLAAALTAEGLGRGDRVAALATTRPEYVELYLAAAKVGITVVALNYRLRSDELVHCATLGAPRLLFLSPGLAEAGGAIVAAVPSITRTVAFGATPGDPDSAFERFLAGGTATPPPNRSEPEDIHCVLFTSGTTGRPKGAMISQRASVMRALRCWTGSS